MKTTSQWIQSYLNHGVSTLTGSGGSGGMFEGYYLWCFVVAAIILGCFFCMYFTQIYKLTPGWGPVRKFDSYGNEDLRLKQLAIAAHVEAYHDRLAKEASDSRVRTYKHPDGTVERVHYGTLEPPSWGRCEVPWQRDVRVWYPGVGEVIMKEGFSDTQQLRMESRSWAKDEAHYLHTVCGVQPRPLDYADDTAHHCVQRMI
mmetsp:Transcript_41993/g.96429  ORF Transcript_41993/g.96429 Transcript_41993/m.96429 type:complete len:201 (+) Transcript_41993:131-733(+)